MIEIAGIDHLVLRTNQIEAMLEFYCAVLGCQVERETTPEIGLTMLRAGNAMIDLVAVDSELGREGGGAPGDEGNNLDHFCLQIKPLSVAQITAHLQAHDVEVPEFAHRYGAQGQHETVYINDPDGNRVELVVQV